MKNYGFIKAGFAVPQLSIGNPDSNAAKIIQLIRQASSSGIKIIVFPELSITSYTSQDLFGNVSLLENSIKALISIAENTKFENILSVVGLPVMWGNSLYNCAAAVCRGEILGLVPKSYIPNYKEFYESRWFTSGKDIKGCSITIGGKEVPFGTDILLRDTTYAGITVGIEICEDLWVPNPPSSTLATCGAVIICNLSASNGLVGKNDYRKSLISSQSARTVSGYIYASSGISESTTDAVFDGAGFIYENGIPLCESELYSFEDQIVHSDIDIERLLLDRTRTGTFDTRHNDCRIIDYALEEVFTDIERPVDPHPFVPSNESDLKKRCIEIITIQSRGLAARIKSIGSPKAVIGLSGGLDSTLALLVTIKAFTDIGKPLSDIIGVTMPGFGTTGMTLNAVTELCSELGIGLENIGIKDISELMFEKIGQEPAVHDITYENVQARARTYILMSMANKHGGIVIGTGDLSEIALGWSTYNGDHISMYNVNSSIPKTLVKFLIKQLSTMDFSKKAAEILERILGFPITPELLPSDGKNFVQDTEEKIGPYELNDFFLYYFVRFGFSAEKIVYLCVKAFRDRYSETDIKRHYDNFIKRFFASQWKRDCVPGGPKVGSIDLSPRSSWRMSTESCMNIFR